MVLMGVWELNLAEWEHVVTCTPRIIDELFLSNFDVCLEWWRIG